MFWKIAICIFIFSVALHLYLSQEESFDPEYVKGKRVLITGASSGIGEQLAYKYAENGAHVFITARREHLLKQVADKCKQVAPASIKIGYIAADMGNLKNAEAIIEKAIFILGGLDQLILNHALIPPMDDWKHTQNNLTELDKEFHINFFSHVHLAKYAQQYLEKTNGSIGVISSYSGKIVSPHLSIYSSTKHALIGFFSALGIENELNGVNVSVTVFTLGYIETEMGTSRIEIWMNRMGKTMSEFVKVIPHATSAKCAMKIMRSVSLRHREVYYPKSVFITIQRLIHLLFPDLAAKMSRSFYKKLDS